MTEFLLNFNSHFEKILFNSEQALLKFIDFMFLASPFILTVLVFLLLLGLFLLICSHLYEFIMEYLVHKEHHAKYWQDSETK